jgi:hypothetical protein
VILDLNFPAGNSVNDFISKDNYLGEIIQSYRPYLQFLHHPNHLNNLQPYIPLYNKQKLTAVVIFWQIYALDLNSMGKTRLVNNLSVSKKDTLERRVILDLNLPAGNSVNDFISKDNYLGEIIQSYPNVDDLVGIY